MEAETVKTIITEGKAKIFVSDGNVFYNPVQEFNRDLSIAVLNVFSEDHIQDLKLKQEKNKQKKLGNNTDVMDKDMWVVDNEKLAAGITQKDGLRILEALAATGLRSIRYAKEVKGVESIIANDLSANAVESLKFNIKENNVEDLVKVSHDDACMVMYQHIRQLGRFSAVDLDPYGCPSVFLDSAVQCLNEGGLLLVTATDMAVLAGNSPETCYSKYGAISLKTKACHEMAVRILLQCIESHANRYGRYIVPLLSISADFYIRVFVKVYTGPIHCKKSTSKLSMIFQCVNCETFTLQPLGGFKPNPSENDPGRLKSFLPHAPSVSSNCQHCNQRHHMGGPIWSDRIHDPEFVNRILRHVENDLDRYNTSRRIMGLLSMVNEELLDAPLYYVLDKLFSTVHLETMAATTMRSAIINSGYKVSYSHASKKSIKTNAPASFIWDIVREWERTHPIKKAKLDADLAAQFLLNQPITNTIDMSLRPDANPTSRKEGFLRFQFNPTPNWGPGTRATTNTNEGKIAKSRRNQNKKSKNIDKIDPSSKRDLILSPGEINDAKQMKLNL